MRKPIQIACSECEDFYQIVALCNDGTIWKTTSTEKPWVQLPEIPQPEKASPERTCERCSYWKHGWCGHHMSGGFSANSSCSEFCAKALEVK